MTNIDDVRNVVVNSSTLEKVREYVYLGQILKLNKENQTAEIARRTRLPWVRFGKLSWALKNHKIALYLRSRIFNQCILPIWLPNLDTYKNQHGKIVENREPWKG